MLDRFNGVRDTVTGTEVAGTRKLKNLDGQAGVLGNDLRDVLHGGLQRVQLFGKAFVNGGRGRQCVLARDQCLKLTVGQQIPEAQRAFHRIRYGVRVARFGEELVARAEQTKRTVLIHLP